jgi:hypothetical protein
MTIILTPTVTLVHLSHLELGHLTASPDQGVIEIFTLDGEPRATIKAHGDAFAGIIAELEADGWMDAELVQRFEDEREWARWVQEVPLADGSMASVYVTPRHPLELRESMVWSVDAAHALALAG